MDDVPVFLKSFDNLTAHFEEHFGELGSNERGDNFLALACRLVPLTAEAQGFGELLLSERKSHDKGVDLFTATNEKNETLCVQSKYRIRSKDEIDVIISKFKNYEAQNNGIPDGTFPSFAEDSQRRFTFMIITSSKLDGIIDLYKSTYLASKAYYNQLVKQGRLVVIDGTRILGILQSLYRKAHLLPTDVEVSATHGWITVGSVRLGTIRGSDLLKLYERHGDSLFFENIRDFLGVSSGKKAVNDRETVNDEIMRTINVEPHKLLERNNGITFRAENLAEKTTDTYILNNASIVNGCQTTMCLVHCGEKSNDCLVQVKIVVAQEAWEIAKAANYQNQVARIELDLAKYLRPQIMKKFAANLGYAYAYEDSSKKSSDIDVTAKGILDSIYQHKVAYDEMRAVFLGLFSRRPNNLFENNYTDVRTDILDEIYRTSDIDSDVFACLFKVLQATREANYKCEQVFDGEEYARLFNRFFDDNKPQYRAFLAVLTLCGLHRDDISNRGPETRREAERTLRFFAETSRLLDNEPEKYQRFFLLAFQVLATSTLDATTSGEESEISRKMLARIKDTQFSTHYKKLRMQIDAESARLGTR